MLMLDMSYLNIKGASIREATEAQTAYWPAEDSALVLGVTFLCGGMTAFASSSRALTGLSALVLGLRAIVGLSPVVLVLSALACLGASALLRGAVTCVRMELLAHE
jgi:hypothetical protein